MRERATHAIAGGPLHVDQRCLLGGREDLRGQLLGRSKRAEVEVRPRQAHPLERGGSDGAEEVEVGDGLHEQRGPVLRDPPRVEPRSREAH
jgi:hypothetical protein